MIYKTRLLEGKLKEVGRHFSVVVLTGARQVGKTTLLRHLLPDAEHITFDPVIDIGNARSDPELFLSQLSPPVILDEIQYAPELLAVIKRRVDVNKKPGQYWLTGSQNLSVIKNIAESLAGRAAVLSLYPMSLGETISQPVCWIESFLQDPEFFLKNPLSRITTQRSLFEILWRGGYPGLLELPDNLLHAGLESYLRTYIERDIRVLSDIGNLQEFTRFVQLAANLSAQEINYSQLGREIGITPQTARRWLNLLISTFQWTEIPSFFGNSIKRLSGKNKGYLIDTGILCYLVHISSPKALLGYPKLGALFETFVVQDLLKQINSLSSKPAMYHWRVHSGAEVNLILERDNYYFPIEIKCKSRPSKADAIGIKIFRETYPKLKTGPGLVIAPTESAFALGENCFAVPYDLG
jgi:predicted AAA+ superfamily ATPase